MICLCKCSSLGKLMHLHIKPPQELCFKSSKTPESLRLLTVRFFVSACCCKSYSMSYIHKKIRKGRSWVILPETSYKCHYIFINSTNQKKLPQKKQLLSTNVKHAFQAVDSNRCVWHTTFPTDTKQAFSYLKEKKKEKKSSVAFHIQM